MKKTPLFHKIIFLIIPPLVLFTSSLILENHSYFPKLQYYLDWAITVYLALLFILLIVYYINRATEATKFIVKVRKINFGFKNGQLEVALKQKPKNIRKI